MPSRNLEQTSGTGTLRTEDGSKSWRVAFSLRIDVERIRAGDEWVEGIPDVKARVTTGLTNLDAIDLINSGVPLVLELQDGRRLPCWYQQGGELITRGNFK